MLLTAVCTLLPAVDAAAHRGRRLEVVVVDGRLAARGYDSALTPRPGGSPRPYLNAVHDEWSPFFQFSLADLPGFDVLTDAESPHGDGGAETLAGGDLVLTLVDSAKAGGDWFAGGRLTELTETIEVGFAEQPGVTTAAPGPLLLSSSIAAAGAADLDLDFFVASQTEGELHVLAWELSTTATFADGRPIANSLPVFTVLAPDGGSLAEEALRLEHYLATPLVAGDVDRNGAVGPEDYAVWASSFGAAPRFAGSGADLDRSRLVDAADYTAWRDSIGAPWAAVRVAAVPEPTNAGLLAAAGLLCRAIGRRRQARPATRTPPAPPCRAAATAGRPASCRRS